MNWISVDERMPEKLVPIFVLTRYGTHLGAYYDGERFIDSYRGEDILLIIEYWMPLPEMPEDILLPPEIQKLFNAKFLGEE